MIHIHSRHEDAPNDVTVGYLCTLEAKEARPCETGSIDFNKEIAHHLLSRPLYKRFKSTARFSTKMGNVVVLGLNLGFLNRSTRGRIQLFGRVTSWNPHLDRPSTKHPVKYSHRSQRALMSVEILASSTCLEGCQSTCEAF